MSPGSEKPGPSGPRSVSLRRSRARRSFLPVGEILEGRQMLASSVLADVLAAGPLTTLLEPAGVHADLKHKKPPPPAIAASVLSGPDAHGVVTITGHTYTRA